MGHKIDRCSSICIYPLLFFRMLSPVLIIAKTPISKYIWRLLWPQPLPRTTGTHCWLSNHGSCRRTRTSELYHPHCEVMPLYICTYHGMPMAKTCTQPSICWWIRTMSESEFEIVYSTNTQGLQFLIWSHTPMQHNDDRAAVVMSDKSKTRIPRPETPQNPAGGQQSA